MQKNQFKALHYQKTPLMICNVWDLASTKTAEKLKFNVIGTSSAAISSMLGYEDGEKMTFEEMLFMVKRIAICSNRPLSVDLEAGYSQDPLITASYIKTLAEIGVVGINLEDSKVNQVRSLTDANKFAEYLFVIKQQLIKDQVDVFINARTDTFLLGKEDAVAETQERAKLYEAAGADGLFVPCITKSEDIKAIISATPLPLNVMCMPDLPDFKSLTRLGVKRISMGNFLFDKLQNDFETRLNNIQKENSFQPVF